VLLDQNIEKRFFASLGPHLLCTCEHLQGGVRSPQALLLDQHSGEAPFYVT
jgi:hypothetical protein